VWSLRDTFCAMLLYLDEDLSKMIASFTDFDNENPTAAKFTIINLIFKQQSSTGRRGGRGCASPL